MEYSPRIAVGLALIFAVHLSVPRALRAADCNNNGMPDDEDITTGTSPDCSGLESERCVAQNTQGCGDSSIEQCVCDKPDLGDCCSDLWDQDCADASADCGGGCKNEAGGDEPDGIPDECQPGPDCLPIGATGR